MHVSGKTRVVLVILLIVLGLLLINRRHVKRRPPIASISSMEDKRREWSANYAATLGPPLPMHKVTDQQIPGPAGPLSLRLYWPVDTPDLPVLVWFHGGGFAFGSLDSHDSICRAYADAFKALVVSVAYRLAPENPFPAGLEDCYAATSWVCDHAAEVGGNPETLAVGGDSAGANFATAVMLMAKEKAAPMIRFQILVSPVLAWHTPGTASYVEFANGFPSRARMEEILGMYMQSDDTKNPLAFPLNAVDLSGLPAALIFAAEEDVLRDEAEAYAARLLAARVDMTVRRFKGAQHVGMSSVKASASDFYFGLALIRAHWQHALGVTG